jgi:hypothetical protein
MASKNSKLIKEGQKHKAGSAPVCDENWNKRVIIFTPSRGLVRTEWVQARYGQIIPTNWSMVEFTQFVHPYLPIGYQLADAQNLLARVVVEGDYDWVIYIEDDNVIPPETIRKFNEYMLDGKIPVVSGVYFTKSVPAEPLIYRGSGNGHFRDWKMGDKVWCDGIPFGCRLEHAGLIKEAWKNSPEYFVGDQKTRRVFQQPSRITYNEERMGIETLGGTTDLEWCKRIIRENLLEKIGYPEIAKMKYPYLCDTTIFVKHIDQNGRMYPLEIPKHHLPDAE